MIPTPGFYNHETLGGNYKKADINVFSLPTRVEKSGDPSGHA